MIIFRCHFSSLIEVDLFHYFKFRKNQAKMEIQPNISAHSVVPFLQYLASQDFQLAQLMLRPSIETDLRINRSAFVDFCRTHSSVAIQLMNRALLTSQFQNQPQKQISSACNSFMKQSCDEITGLLVGEEETQKSDSQMKQLKGAEEETECKHDNVQKYSYLKYLLNFLQTPIESLNHTSVSQIMKVLDNIRQRNCKALFIFYQQDSHSLDRLVQISKYFNGVADMFGKLITQECPGYYQIKEAILQAIVAELKRSQVLENDNFEYFLDLIEIVLTRSKFNSENKDRKNLAQKLVDGQIITFFIREILAMTRVKTFDLNNQKRLKNSLNYLILVAKRLSEDDEVNSRITTENKALSDPTLVFDLQTILENFKDLLVVQLPPQYSSLTKLAYYEFLTKIKKNRYFSEMKFNDATATIELIKILKNEPSCGIIETYIVDLIEYSINRLETITGIEALKIVSAIGPTENLRKNSRETVCFITKIIIIMIDRSSIFINQYKHMKIQETIDNYVRVVGLHSLVRKKWCPQLKFLEKHQEKAKQQPPQSDDSSSSDDLEFRPKTPFSSNFEVRWVEDSSFTNSGFENSDSESSGFGGSFDNNFLSPQGQNFQEEDDD